MHGAHAYKAESGMNIAVFLVEDNILIRDSLVAALVDLANAKVVHVSEGESEQCDGSKTSSTGTSRWWICFSRKAAGWAS